MKQSSEDLGEVLEAPDQTQMMLEMDQMDEVDDITGMVEEGALKEALHYRSSKLKLDNDQHKANRSPDFGWILSSSQCEVSLKDEAKVVVPSKILNHISEALHEELSFTNGKVVLLDCDLDTFAAIYEYACRSAYNVPAMKQPDISSLMFANPSQKFDPSTYFAKSNTPSSKNDLGHWSNFKNAYKGELYGKNDYRNPIFHAKIFCFAESWLAPGLLQYALTRLWYDLKHFVVQADTLPYLLSLVKLVYGKSRYYSVWIDSRLRALVSLHLSSWFADLSCHTEFLECMKTNAELASDLAMLLGKVAGTETNERN